MTVEDVAGLGQSLKVGFGKAAYVAAAVVADQVAGEFEKTNHGFAPVGGS